jgi:hypothetical protein
VRTAILLGGLLGLLALVAAGCGGSSGTVTQGTGGGKKPIVKETQKEGQIGNVTPPGALSPNDSPDPDSENMGGSDANTSIVHEGPTTWQLVIQNTSRVGYIDSIYWKPPPGATITSVTSSSRGSCSLASDGEISCEGLNLKPPTCTCLPGGTATVNFVMTEPNNYRGGGRSTVGIENSGLEIVEMRPILGNIPSARGQSPAGNE